MGEAESLLRQALAILETGPYDDPVEISETLANLGGLLREREKPEEAERLLRRALDIRETELGEDHYLVAETFVGLADCSATSAAMTRRKHLSYVRLRSVKRFWKTAMRNVPTG